MPGPPGYSQLKNVTIFPFLFLFSIFFFLFLFNGLRSLLLSSQITDYCRVYGECVYKQGISFEGSSLKEARIEGQTQPKAKLATHIFTAKYKFC